METHLIDFKYLLISIVFIVGYVLGVSWLLSLIKIRLGLYVVDGTQEEIIKKLYNLLRERGEKDLSIDLKKGKVGLFGLSNVINILIYRLDGDRIEFIVRSFQPNKVQIDVRAYKAFATFLKTFRFFSYTRKEWQRYGYNAEKLDEVIRNLK